MTIIEKKVVKICV